jgi:hypothetical protein
MSHTADNDAPRRKGLRAWLSRLLNECQYCKHDRRSQACCGIVYMDDRTDEPVSHAQGRRCDCDQCWPTSVTPPEVGQS